MPTSCYTSEDLARLALTLNRPRPLESPSPHYAALRPQPIEVMRAWMTTDQFIGFCLGNVVKYAGRFNSTAPHKGGIHCLEKMRDYIEWAIDARYAEAAQSSRVMPDA